MIHILQMFLSGLQKTPFVREDFVNEKSSAISTFECVCACLCVCVEQPADTEFEVCIGQ